MKKIFFALFTALCFQYTNAQEYKLLLWPSGNVPNYKKTTEVEKRDSVNDLKIKKNAWSCKLTA